MIIKIIVIMFAIIFLYVTIFTINDERIIATETEIANCFSLGGAINVTLFGQNLRYCFFEKKDSNREMERYILDGNKMEFIDNVLIGGSGNPQYRKGDEEK